MKKVKIRKILASFLIVLCFCLTLTKVDAASTITITKPDSLETGRTYIGMQDNRTVVTGTGELVYNHQYFPVISYKTASYTAPLLCATGINENPPISGLTCTLDSSHETSLASYGAAYIIMKIAEDAGYSCSEGAETCGIPDNADMLSQNTEYYYWMELLTLGYMGIANGGSSGDLLYYRDINYSQFKNDYINGDKDIWLGNNSFKWNDIMEEADEYARKTYPTISFSSNNLSFTKNGSNYESNWITVSGNNELYSLEKGDSDIGKENIKIESDLANKRFRVIVSNVKSSVKNITVNVKAGKTSYHSSRYNCGNNYQEVIPAKVFKHTLYNDAKITGSITIAEPTPVTVRFTKVNQDKVELPGAVLHIKGDNGVDKDIIFNSTTKQYESLLDGTYTVTEKTAPSGCEKSNKSITIKIEDGKSYINGTKSSYLTFENECDVDNEKVRVTINKVDKDQYLIDDDEIEFKLVEVVNGKEDEDTLNVLNGGASKVYLEKGKQYRLTETVAPDGYEKLKNYVTITVSDDGKISSSACYEDCKNNILHVVNTKTEEIVGEIILSIKKTDGNGNLLNNVKMSFLEEGNKSTIYSWTTTSGKNPYNITLQKNTTYILREVTAPKGYTAVKDTKVFVDEDGNISIDYQGEEKNAPVVCESKSCETILVKNVEGTKVPNTAASRSAFLIISGILLSVLGVALGINAVRKNKKV